MANKENFAKRLEHLKHEVLNNPEVRDFLDRHQDRLTEGMIDRSLMKLYEYANQSKDCNKCDNLDRCRNILQGYHPQLVFHGNNIDIHYEKCPRKALHDDRKKNESLIKSMYIPKDILKASMDHIALDEPSRLKAVSIAQDFVEKYEPGKKMKGLYLYGPFGVGKTFILGAVATELAQKQVSSMLIYLPEFLRELKGSLQDNTLNEKIEGVKHVPVLMFDDIGAESMSSWMRDEILGTILQYRMLENLPVFFTSNFDFAQLEHHLSYTQRGEEEKLKAARIMERIKYLAVPVEIKGKNRRL